MRDSREKEARMRDEDPYPPLPDPALISLRKGAHSHHLFIATTVSCLENSFLF